MLHPLLLLLMPLLQLLSLLLVLLFNLLLAGIIRLLLCHALMFLVLLLLELLLTGLLCQLSPNHCFRVRSTVSILLLCRLLLSLRKRFDHVHDPTKSIPELFDKLLVFGVLAQLLHVLADVIGEPD